MIAIVGVRVVRSKVRLASLAADTCRWDDTVDATAPPPGISAGSIWLRQRGSAVTALAWTAPAQAPHRWLAAAHAGGEVDIFTYDMKDLLPGATISFRSPSAALALAWNPHRPHVLVTGASDQTVRGWNVTLPKYAHPDAVAPLLLAADHGSGAAATLVDDDPALDASENSSIREQVSASPAALTSSEHAAPAPASAAAGDSAACRAEAPVDGTTLSVPSEASATGLRSAQTARNAQAAAEMQDAHVDARVPLFPAADDGSEAAATSADDEPAQEAAGGQMSDAQENTSAKPLSATGDAGAVSAIAASASHATGQAEGGAASGAPIKAAATDMRFAQAALDEQPAAELQHTQPALCNAAEAPPREPLASDSDALVEVSTAEASPQQQDSQQSTDTAAGAVAAGELPAQTASNVSPEQQDAVEVMVSRPVDLAEVAAIRRGRAAPPAKSPMRAAASLSVGSLVGRLRREEATDDMAATTDPSATTDGGDVGVGCEIAGGVSGHATDTVGEPGGRIDAAGRIEDSAIQSAAEPGSERSFRDQTQEAEVSTRPASNSAAESVPAAEPLPREGARPTHGAVLPLQPLYPRHAASCNVPSNGVQRPLELWCRHEHVSPATSHFILMQHSMRSLLHHGDSCCADAMGAAAPGKRGKQRVPAPGAGSLLPAPSQLQDPSEQVEFVRTWLTCSVLHLLHQAECRPSVSWPGCTLPVQAPDACIQMHIPQHIEQTNRFDKDAAPSC